ncbi:MAG: di-heme oxidoredictase family protein, partial [Planctomycetota bacterium]|nr:di-heme oxidoredictase family protein [Planctomycetota bacterium]
DMLLHDMGPDLADGFREFEAAGSEWRTAPLWAAGEVGHVLGTPGECTDPYSGEGTPNYLHDGRARSLMEAILWHGGEAETSRKAVLAMNRQEREALLKYVAYPFDDPSLHDEPFASCPADLDGDGLVDGRDLAVLIDDWGQPGASDLDGSGIVDGRDLTLLLSGWGGCG